MKDATMDMATQVLSGVNSRTLFAALAGGGLVLFVIRVLLLNQYA